MAVVSLFKHLLTRSLTVAVDAAVRRRERVPGDRLRVPNKTSAPLLAVAVVAFGSHERELALITAGTGVNGEAELRLALRVQVIEARRGRRGEESDSNGEVQHAEEIELEKLDKLEMKTRR